jgi:predicted phosphodiesterase
MVLYNQADLHLDTFPWARRPEFKGDAFAAMESSQEVILADPIAPNNEKVVILAGDITEKALIDDATNACIARVLSLYKEKGVQVLYINGNHDKSKHAYRDSCGHVGIHGGIHIGNGEEVVIGSLRIRGLDWMPRSELREKIQDIPECDILVIHCAFQHLLGFAGSFDLVADDVPATVKHSVLVGDVHVTNVTKNINGTQIVSPGPLHPCSISQKGPHGTMRLVEGQDHWEFLEHTSRQVLDYTLD